MRVLVTGSVRWTDAAVIESSLEDCLAIDSAMTLITGMAAGADALARAWAQRAGVSVLAEPLADGVYPHPMHRYNRRMLRWKPDLVLAFKADFDLVNHGHAGTEHMCALATAACIPVQVFCALPRGVHNSGSGSGGQVVELHEEASVG